MRREHLITLYGNPMIITVLDGLPVRVHDLTDGIDLPFDALLAHVQQEIFNKIEEMEHEKS